MSKIVFDSDNCQKPIFGQIYIIVILNDENMQHIVLFIQVNKLLKPGLGLYWVKPV